VLDSERRILPKSMRRSTLSTQCASLVSIHDDTARLTLHGMTLIHLPIDFFRPQAQQDLPGTLLSLPVSVADWVSLSSEAKRLELRLTARILSVGESGSERMGGKPGRSLAR
jgi:hypothetical protein